MSLLAIIGPTASGKTHRAVQCAKAFNGEIISADSRQIYTGMDLGTGKDLNEYDGVPYHLIDIAPAGYKYNLYEYLRDANAALEDIRSRDTLPIVCGGTGLYVESILNGVRLPEVPENHELRQKLSGMSIEALTEILSGMKRLHNTTDVDTAQRAIRAIEIETYYQTHPDQAIETRPNPISDAIIIGVDIDRESRRQRISQRLIQRINDGMIDEVRQLLDQGISAADLIYYGLEYKFLTLYITGALSKDEMIQSLEIAIHQFAKRQMTWFRGMERRGFTIHWLPWDMPDSEFIQHVATFL